MSDLDRSLRGLGNKDVGSTSRTQSEKPTRAPENKDKFKKLVERRTERAPDEDDQEELTLADSNSVFDLAAKKAGHDQQMQLTPPPLSPFDLAAKGPLKKGKEMGMDRESAADLASLATRAEANQSQDDAIKGRSFAQVRDDLTYVNPSMQMGVSNVSASVDAAVAKPSPVSQTLIDQIVDKLYTVKTGDVTDTVMTIKNPPVFAGSQLVVTSYDTAKGEFNIAFTNLTQEAKTLLDSQHAALMNALVEKGYVAHIVVTTTEPYTRLTAQGGEAQMGEGGQLPGETIEQARKRLRDEQREEL